MATPGLDVIMSWTPNYDHPHEPLDAVIYGVNIPLMVLMTIFVAGRFLSRTFLVRNALGVDDWMMLVAYVGASAGFGRTSTVCALFCNNEDIDMFDIPSPFPVKDKQMVQLYFDGHSGGIWNFNDRNYAFAMHVGSACHAVTPYADASRPLSDLWAVFKPMSQKQCIESEKFYIAVAAINSITDFMVYLWPIHYLWKVKLSLAKRAGLIICFGVGVLICIAGVVRITWQVKFANSWDQTYNGAIIFVIVAVECNLGVVCGCLPGVRPLMSKIFPGLTSSTYNSGRGKNSHVQVSSNNRPGGGYHDLHSIHVRKEVELSVVKRPADGP
ncbi:hypothetical protein AN4213.2 [Aspergillus nidulans FGSC A4]|uniref:Rhodopsin domain-containing protein n=1 Tax=Emericella nidulans (strain FGSC A4 / ATCC 38163 / CBS 112.46 / NRRL 194 / M139) TaxID=227321 RepID=Q5B5G7_EMENI|nr:hypothetical protein [Aspergillus nidulans FGSC A4]EAA59312.1 hypothetical protein AN4213.2 [Aspergillus nidulans FGSC A4]CBF74469.1 TPA: conserved hypothetical protein [Aspergillus nidulans FGSC A4]|eukprot:XP_661817.1 hypothetical protein AN4213.2 [Aspergillus nidulans FGSC A4]